MPIKPTLRLKRLGICTYKEAVVYLHQGSSICQSEGFAAQSRIKITVGNKSILATINTITSANLLADNEAGLSEYAWKLLDVPEGTLAELSHPSPLNSMGHIRSKIYGKQLDEHALKEIIQDIVSGNLSDIQIASFLTASAGKQMNRLEMKLLTEAMIRVGNRLQWDAPLVVDKHSLGGIPGNRTTLIVVPIVAEFGLTIPKTSSHAITSPAGTADTMEVLAPVDLSLTAMRKVVEQENGCIVCGAAAHLSPADEIMVRIEHVLNFDSQSQAVASVLSKKVAAGSTHVLIDIPVGPLAKVRSEAEKLSLQAALEGVGGSIGLTIKTIFTDGSKPIGRGIGPVMEALDVLGVLENRPSAAGDLREKSLMLAGQLIEFAGKVQPGNGIKIAREILQSGKAFNKLAAICQAQGGMRIPKPGKYTSTFEALASGKVIGVNNQYLALVAKLAGAPNILGAGAYLHANVGSDITKGEPLLTIYAASPGELDYAMSFINSGRNIFQIV